MSEPITLPMYVEKNDETVAQYVTSPFRGTVVQQSLNRHPERVDRRAVGLAPHEPERTEGTSTT